MKRVTVFCGSSFGTDDIFALQATLLGQTLAKNNIELVYGGANVGLMGAVADGVLNNNGTVIGVTLFSKIKRNCTRKFDRINIGGHNARTKNQNE
jgi:predicted Rossmann-fold nucleotide-binding protein